MSIYKKFLSYVIPSILAFALAGVYAIVDGFFVGNSIGDIGLSAINISYPIVSLIQATGTGIGMGGAILYSIAYSKKEKDKAKKITTSTIIALALSSILLMIVLLFFLNPILSVMGAKDNLMILGYDYLKWIVIGAGFQIFATGLIPIIRNHNGSTFAMISMVAGFITNIFLDYLFVWVFNRGMEGAAIATIMGQAVTMILAIAYLVNKKLEISKITVKELFGYFLEIVKTAIAPFGLTLSPLLSLILMNRSSMVYGGTSAVATYACISYATTIVYLLLQGVGDGSQPIISSYYGKGDEKKLKDTITLAYLFSLLIALICIWILYIFRYSIGNVFGASNEIRISVGNTIFIFLTGFVFLSFSRITTSGFYAMHKNLYSYILVYIEPILIFIMLLILPKFLGQNGVWWSMVTSQIITSFISLILKKIVK